MEIVLKLIFVVTALIVIMTSFKLIGLIFGNAINLPRLLFGRNKIGKYFDMDEGYILYPAWGYQIYFWFTYLNVI